MKRDYSDLEALAERAADENWRFRSFLKMYDEMPEEALDRLVFRIADRVEAEIDCGACGRCCKTLKFEMSDADQRRLAARLGLSVEALREEYLEFVEEDGEKGWWIRTSPCPFLENNQCTVYEDRPDNCRGYPFLHEPEFTYRTWGMIDRTYTCPIVFQVMEALKKELRFQERGFSWESLGY